jgi:hypothetical protein
MRKYQLVISGIDKEMTRGIRFQWNGGLGYLNGKRCKYMGFDEYEKWHDTSKEPK